MTRKRTPIARARSVATCPVCGGRSVLKTAAHHVLRDPARDPARVTPVGDAREFRILGAQSGDRPVPEEEAQSLTMLSDFIGKSRFRWQVESAYHQEQYDIVLM